MTPETETPLLWRRSLTGWFAALRRMQPPRPAGTPPQEGNWSAVVPSGPRLPAGLAGKDQPACERGEEAWSFASGWANDHFDAPALPGTTAQSS